MRKAFFYIVLFLTAFLLTGCDGSKNVQVKSSGFCCHAVIESGNGTFEGLMCVDEGSVSFEIESPSIIKGVKFKAGDGSLSVGYGNISKSVESEYVRELSFLTDIYRCFKSLPENTVLSFKDGAGVYSGTFDGIDFNMSFTTSGYPVGLTVGGRDIKVALSDHGPAE